MKLETATLFILYATSLLFVFCFFFKSSNVREVKEMLKYYHSIPAFELRANGRKRFVIKLPPETLEILTVGKTVDSRLPRSVMDTAALSADNTETRVQMEKIWRETVKKIMI